MAKATKKEESVTKQKSVGRKKQLTVRERAEATQNAKPARIRRVGTKVASPLKRVGKLRKKRERKGIRIFGRRIRLFPAFIGNAWREIRQVTWPNRRETTRLTIAVFIFALIFALFVGLLDYGLDKLFKEVIIK